MKKTRQLSAPVTALAEEAGGGDSAASALVRMRGSLVETRGVVFLEYMALLILVTVIGSAAVVMLGVPLITLFRFQQMMLALPIP